MIEIQNHTQQQADLRLTQRKADVFGTLNALLAILVFASIIIGLALAVGAWRWAI